jgi:hypothetical protein
MDEITPLVFKVGEKQVVVEETENSVKLVQEFLNKNTPSIEEYAHKEWSDEIYEKVAEAIVSIIQPRPVLEMVLNRTKDEKMKSLINSKINKTPSSSSTLSSELDSDLEFKSESNTPLEPVSETEDTSSSDEYDSLFNDL